MLAIILKKLKKKLNSTFASLRWKTIIIYFSIFIFAFGFISFTLGSLVTDFLTQERVNSETNINAQFSSTISAYIINKDDYALNEQTTSYGAQHSGRFIVVATDGQILSDSYNSLLDNNYLMEETNEIKSGEKNGVHHFYHEEIDGNSISFVRYINGIFSDGELLGFTVFESSFEDIQRSIQDIYISIVTIAIVASIAVFILCLVSTHYITKPLISLSTALQNISNGDFSTQIDVHGNSEIDEVTNTFNLMSKKLANIDRLRNEFVSNASHELRTPLSSIKILIQNMIYEDSMNAEVRTEFLKDIDYEIDRLNNIIEDLLNLVQTNNTKSALTLTNTDISNLIQSTADKLIPLATKKEITIHTKLEEGLTLKCDKLKLQICLSNLIDNAIKYGNRQGNVYISSAKTANNIIIIVKDDGIGIPSRDLPNIFDRFYRVDKTRSRSTGGTGLGLSITQRVIHLHGGTISTKSKINQGTEFTIALPIFD